MGKSLEQVDEKATAATAKVNDLVKRLDGLEQQAKSFGDVEKRVQALISTATQAQQAAEKILGARRRAAGAPPPGDTSCRRRRSKHRRASRRSRRSAPRSRSSATSCGSRRPRSKQSVDSATALRGELDQVRGVAGAAGPGLRQAARDLARGEGRFDRRDRQPSRKSRRSSVPLMQLQELSKTTEEKLTSLNALAEHVSQKAKALEAQKHTIDRAVVEANRLNEMVWSMDVQVGKLNEGLKQAARGEETVARIEKLVAETNASVDAATKVRDEFAREAGRLEKDGRALVDVMRSYVEKLGAREEGVRGVRPAAAGAAGRRWARPRRGWTRSARRRSTSSALNQRVDGLSKDFQTLLSQADELTRKQVSLEALNERLAQVDDLAKRTALQYDSLKQTPHRPRDAAQRDPGLPQVVRRHRAAARQARRRPRGARGVRRPPDVVQGAHAGARGDDGRDPRQAGLGRRGHASTRPASASSPPSSTRS